MTSRVPSQIPCATCGRPAARAGNAAFPFCSPRCQAADLGSWLGEEYRIPDLETPVELPAGAAAREDER